MTLDQQTALEAVAGRALSSEEIQVLDPLVSLRNDVETAKILSRGRIKVQPSPIGIGTVLAVMAPLGGEFLNALESMGATDANVKWALKMIEQSTFDVGHSVTRVQLEKFASSVPEMAAAVGALLVVAEVADPINYNTVSDALNIAEGRVTL